MHVKRYLKSTEPAVAVDYRVMRGLSYFNRPDNDVLRQSARNSNPALVAEKIVYKV